MKLLGLNITLARNQNSKTANQKSFTDPLWADGGPAHDPGPLMRNAYEQVVWVYRAINILAEQVANIPFLFSRGESGRENLITSGPLCDFYDQPHPHINRFQYWELRILWLMLRGESIRIPIYDDAVSSSLAAPKRTLQWINELPEVLAVLKDEFEGVPISSQNLSDWKKSGFLNWQLSQAALQFTNESLSDELDTATLEKMSAKLLRYLQVRYAALAGSLPELNRDDPDAELHRLAGLCTNLSTLRRGDLSAERLALEHERLALERCREEAEREKLFWEWTKRPDVQEKLYPHRDADKHRRDVERVLNLRLLGVKTPETQPDDSIDPAVLI